MPGTLIPRPISASGFLREIEAHLRRIAGTPRAQIQADTMLRLIEPQNQQLARMCSEVMKNCQREALTRSQFRSLQQDAPQVVRLLSQIPSA